MFIYTTALAEQLCLETVFNSFWETTPKVAEHEAVHVKH